MKSLQFLFSDFPIIESKRLILRQLTIDDAADFYACNRFDTFAWAENIASTRVMEKADMRFEGLARQRRFAKGSFHDVEYYAILREDYSNGK